MNRLTKLVIILAAVMLLAGPAFGEEGGNPKKGKYLWKKNCKTCHVEGQEGGELSPNSKTQNQWNAFFENDSATEKCKKISGSENDLHDIQHYMHDHAMDSDQPETCG
jgi:cytochrome c5